jgi:hypothetical protein
MNLSSHAEPIDFVLNGFMNLANGLRNIANNQGLPDMVRNDFNALADTAQCVMAPVQTVRTNAIMSGYGPRSLGLRDAARWLKLPLDGIDLNNLAPKVSFDWRTQPSSDEAADSDRFQRLWSQFFLTPYPLELFSDEDYTVQVMYEVDGYDFEVTAFAQLPTMGVDDPLPLLVHLKEIQVRYEPREKFWRGFATISRSAALFRDDPLSHFGVTHLVEGLVLNPQLKGTVPFMIDYVISPLAHRLSYSFKDYQLAAETGYNEDLKRIVDNIASEYPEHHQDHVRNILTRKCGNMGCAKGLDIDVPGLCTVNIVTGSSDLYDYDKWVKKTAEHSWFRDKPLLKIASIMTAGVDVSSRRMPNVWHHRITDAIYEAFRKICAEYPHWPKSPEELAAEKAAKEQE